MKYCVNCEMNLGNIDLLEKDGQTFCPKCQNEMMVINSNRLNDLVSEITNSFYQIKEKKVQNDAQALIFHAKKIEIGEKKLKKEFMKREKQLRELQYELAVISSIGKTLNYNLGDDK